MPASTGHACIVCSYESAPLLQGNDIFANKVEKAEPHGLQFSESKLNELSGSDIFGGAQQVGNSGKMPHVMRNQGPCRLWARHQRWVPLRWQQQLRHSAGSAAPSQQPHRNCRDNAAGLTPTT